MRLWDYRFMYTDLAFGGSMGFMVYCYCRGYLARDSMGFMVPVKVFAFSFLLILFQ